MNQMTNNNLENAMVKGVDLVKVFENGGMNTQVLNHVNIEIKKGEDVCFLGASGAGKSTLLQILGTLDLPTQGEVFFEGQSLSQMNDQELAQFRSEKIGFVFQFHHLIQELTAAENVALPLMLAGEKHEDAVFKAQDLLSHFDLQDRGHHFPNQLSGGELQRVSIARALIRKPRILLADEPTGNLDSENSKKIQDLFFQLHKQLGLTLVVVTHDLQFASRFSKVYRMKDGCLTSN